MFKNLTKEEVMKLEGGRQDQYGAGDSNFNGDLGGDGYPSTTGGAGTVVRPYKK